MAKPHPLLDRYWQGLAPQADERVLVPLCGATPDLGWLAGRGHPVSGVEWSPIAVQRWFAERDLTPAVDESGSLPRLHAPQTTVSLWSGDFFALGPSELGSASLVWDRAALVALPPETRARYAAALCAGLPPEARILLVSFEYPEGHRSGPPHSVDGAEIRALYGARFRIEQLDEQPLPDMSERFGVPWVKRTVWQMGPR